ncbi:MAG: CIA30 family protein [Bacteroidota bacterium]
MTKLLWLFLLLLSTQEMIIFDFSPQSDLTNWIVRDDVVMGGRSQGSFQVNKEGHGVFKGSVSLENNGGFSSVRYRSNRIEVSDYQKVILRLKGDGSRFQFRIKSNRRDYYSYISYFQTNGDWQKVEIAFSEMYPTFRGRKLAMDNYPGEQIEEIAFLIGNKQAQDFELEIDRVWVE